MCGCIFDAHMCVGDCVDVYVCIWRPQINVGCLPLSFSNLALETVPPTETDTHQFG